MPEISRFFGIVIAMYYNDHAPPHFHVRYGGEKAIISITGLSLLEGGLSPKALSLVREWAALHLDELMENWEAARKLKNLKPIAPLE